MHNKTLPILLSTLLLVGCASQPKEEKITEVKEKTFPSSMLLSDSDIYPENLDDYLFLDNTFYVDTRDHLQFLTEGSVAGFINIPFYDFLVDFQYNEDALYTMKRVQNEDGTYNELGEVGSFVPNYEESDEIIQAMFPSDEKILVMSTAGVESTYLCNLLVQLGYEYGNLYNVGGYSNAAVGHACYRELENAKYKVTNIELENVTFDSDWDDLTPTNNQ